MSLLASLPGPALRKALFEGRVALPLSVAMAEGIVIVSVSETEGRRMLRMEDSVATTQREREDVRRALWIFSY